MEFCMKTFWTSEQKNKPYSEFLEDGVQGTASAHNICGVFELLSMKLELESAQNRL